MLVHGVGAARDHRDAPASNPASPSKRHRCSCSSMRSIEVPDVSGRIPQMG
jgi:hypothetical protein